MNRESEAINKFLAWLLQDPNKGVIPSGQSPVHGAELDDLDAASLQFDEIDPLDSEDIRALSTESSGSNRFSFQETPLFYPGDRSAVQDRFHSLLKRRLRSEIERKPPLFPWETEVYEYDSETPDWATSDLVPATPWITQLQNLNVPIPMPENVLSQLFDRCLEVVQSSLREGTKLVQAVEGLFPGNTPALNQLAGLVLTSPARSPLRSPEIASRLPEDYSTATPSQQMVVSMLAAREILETLTLSVSPNEPRAERQWNTTAGPLQLTAEYPSPTGQLRIQSQLPCSGSLRFQGAEAQSIAERSSPGSLSVELFDLAPNQIYPLEIRLAGSEQTPIVFVVHPTTSDV